MPRHPRVSRRSSRSGGRAGLVVGGALMVLLAVGFQLTSNASHPTPMAGTLAPSLTATPTPVATQTPTVAGRDEAGPVLGVFRGGGDPAEVTAFGDWLGRRPRYALTFGDGTSWQTIADPRGLSRWDSSPYRFVYSVPMLPLTGPDTIERGATGAYDRYFEQLARNLVSHGQQDAILRVGWEFNIKNSRWATKNTTAFTTYWRHIVRAVRSVPGGEFEFDWNPVNAHTAYDGSRYYPGGRYVDYIGIDVYDVSWVPHTYPWPRSCTGVCIRLRHEVAWDYLENDEHGLAFWSHFAALKGKPLSVPEWGMWTRPDGRGGGDNTTFVRNMHTFITDPANNVAYQSYFDFDAPDGEHELRTTFPRGGKLFRALFGADGQASGA